MLMKKREMIFFPEHHDGFREALEGFRGKPVAVMGHLRPDGDCIGSVIAMTRMLNASDYGIDAIGINRDPTPVNLKSFVGDTPFYVGGEPSLNGHVPVSVDCADDKRMGNTLRGQFEKIVVNVDHHVSNTSFGEFNFISSDASATAEILAGLFLDLDLPIDPVTAQALYIGIATDTGQFRFASTTPQVFEICCQLCGRGADPAKAAFALYENESFAKLGLLQRFLASLQREFNGRVCVGELHLGDFKETGALAEDTEGLVDYARAIEGVDVGILVEERDDGVKASLRAKDPVYRVHEIARQFNGGGHACAAGLNVKRKSVPKFRRELMDALEQHLASIERS